MSSLAHHGILGQKWGIRRFQNKDGSRTSAGKKKRRTYKSYKEELIEAGKTSLDDLVKKSGGSYVNGASGLSKNGAGKIEQVNTYTDSISKGSILNRVALKGETVDSNRKFLSYSKNDKKTYEEIIKNHGLMAEWDSIDDLLSYEYTTNKDLRIANGKRILKYISDDLKKHPFNARNRELVRSISGYEEAAYIAEGYFNEKRTGEWAKKSPDERKAQWKIVCEANKKLSGMNFVISQYGMPYKEAFKRMSKSLEKEGYDGFFDIVDGRSLERPDRYRDGLADYPIVIINPERSITLNKTKKLKYSAIGGNMNYIYGNTLVLGDSSYLAHHGILGQKWGIRRFQNKDGSRTAEGKKRYKTMQAAHGTRARGNSPFDRAKNRAIDKAKDEFNALLDNARYGKNKAKYDAAVDEWDKAQTHRYDEYEKEFDKYASIAGMANAYRCGWDQPNAGFGSRDNMLEFATEFYKYDDGDQGKFNSYDYFLVGKGENPNDVQDKAFKASSVMWELAKEDAKDLFGDLADKKDGPGSTVATSFASSMFSYATAASPITMVDESSGLRYTDQEIKQMQEDIRKFSVEAKRLGTISHSGVFVENGTLYLCHHGIKNQKWGIRRFQNPDGSLTAAGRIRYGVTGAAKAAFKVGKKLGVATASAARAGVKKAKDNAYAKKKEKVSQTREGVLKNKKMFTADELKALENRFKIEDEMSEASLRHGQAVAKTVSQYANTTRDVLSALQTGGNAVSAITKAFADIQSYQNAKGVAEAAKEKGMTTKEFDLFLKEKYPNAKKDDGSKKKGKNRNKAEHSDSEDDDDDDNPPNNGGGGGSKKQAEYAAKRQAAQETIYKQKASGLKQREDYLNKRQDALVKVSKQRQSEQDARDEDLNRRDKAASEREEKLKSAAKTAADVMSKLNKRKADLDEKEAFLNSEESYRLDTLSEFKKNEEEAARRKKKKVKHSAFEDDMITEINDLMSNDPAYLEHFGIKNMKWGVRRFQNPDGTLTEAGKKRYANVDGSLNAKGRKIDAKRITKQLNANDKASAWAVRRRDDNRELAERNETRAEKARSKGKLERAEKFDTLAKKQRDEQKIQNKKYLDLEAKNGKLVAEAIAKDYDVRQTPMMRDVTNGKEHVANLVIELGATMAGLPFTYKTGVEVPGTDYRVKAKKASKNGQVVLSPAGMAVAAASQKKAKHDGFQIQNGVLMYGFASSDELEHFGIKNMKWGVRRFQNKDGSLTEAGKQRYAKTGNLDSSGGGGGGAPDEEDEETKKAIEEAAKKAGMTVDEYRKKFADKVAEIKKKASETASAVGKSLNDIGSDKVAKSFSKQSYEFANKNAKKAEDYKRKAASAANAGDKDAAAYYNKQASRFETVAKQHGEQGKNWGDTYAETTITGRVKGAANAVKGASKKASEMASDAKYEVGYHAENALDAVTGQRSKRQAKAWTETARYHEKRAEEAKSKYISGTRNPDSFEGEMRNANNAVAARNQKRAKEAQETANAWSNSYKRSLAGRAEAASKKIGAKAQEAKDKLKAKAPNRSMVVNGSAIKKASDTADVYSKYYGAKAKARKIAENSSAEQRVKYGDKRNIREQATANELNNLRAKEKREAAIRSRMTRKFEKKAASARAHGNVDKAEAYSRESSNQFSRAVSAYSKAEAFRDARDTTVANHVVRNAKTAMKARNATLSENRNRNAAHLAERRRERSINEAKAKIRSGKLPTSELTRYAKSTVGQLKSEAKAELARREREQALTSMGSDYARATARVTTTSSTTNTTDAHNEKLARDRRDKRKQAARASATAKKNRLAGSGRTKYTSGQTSSIGRVGSGRGKTSTRR